MDWRCRMRTAVLATLAMLVALTLHGHASASRRQGGRNMESLRGKTVRWTFTDGPTAGIRFEHTLHDDGSITWRALDGPWEGASRQEKQYAAIQVAEQVQAISYLAASGHTLTVVLNFATGRMVGFGSN